MQIYTNILLFVFLSLSTIYCQYDEYNLCKGQLKVSFDTTSKECICKCCDGKDCSPCTYADNMRAKLSMKFGWIENFIFLLLFLYFLSI